MGMFRLDVYFWEWDRQNIYYTIHVFKVGEAGGAH